MKTIGIGCVGECGKTASISHFINKATYLVEITVQTTFTSLSSDYGASAVMQINGRECDKGDITQNGTSISCKAVPEDNVSVIVTLTGAGKPTGKLDFKVTEKQSAP